MRDTAAHLTGANDAYRFDFARHHIIPSEHAGLPRRHMKKGEATFVYPALDFLSTCRQALPRGSQSLFELWQDGEEVTDEAVVCDLEDRGFLVLVDRDDD